MPPVAGTRTPATRAARRRRSSTALTRVPGCEARGNSARPASSVFAVMVTPPPVQLDRLTGDGVGQRAANDANGDVPTGEVADRQRHARHLLGSGICAHGGSGPASGDEKPADAAQARRTMTAAAAEPALVDEPEPRAAALAERRRRRRSRCSHRTCRTLAGRSLRCPGSDAPALGRVRARAAVSARATSRPRRTRRAIARLQLALDQLAIAATRPRRAAS